MGGNEAFRPRDKGTGSVPPNEDSKFVPQNESESVPLCLEQRISRLEYLVDQLDSVLVCQIRLEYSLRARIDKIEVQKATDSKQGSPAP